MNEWFFLSHYDRYSLVPGMLQIESIEQVFIMTFLTLPEYKGKITNFLGAYKLIFSRHIFLVDRHDIEDELVTIRSGITKGKQINCDCRRRVHLIIGIYNWYTRNNVRIFSEL